MTGERAGGRAGVMRIVLMVGAGGFLVLIGVSPVFALASALLVAAAATAWIGLPLDSATSPRVPVAPRPGTRSDVARLAAELRGSRTRTATTARLREIARRRLARRGLSADHPAAGVLAAGTTQGIPIGEVPAALDTLDALDGHPAGVPGARRS